MPHVVPHESEVGGLGLTSHLPTHLVLHTVLVLVLVRLLLLKILIAPPYKHSHGSLRALGATIFVVAFMLVSIPAFSEFLRSTKSGSLGLRLATGVVVLACFVAGPLASWGKTSRTSEFRQVLRCGSVATQKCNGNYQYKDQQTQQTKFNHRRVENGA